MCEQKQNVEKLLAEGKTIQLQPQGDSMYPLLVSGRDWVIIAPVDAQSCKRGDVVLYRREGGILVLHRIWKRKGEHLYMVGDGQKVIEGPLQCEQIRGILIGIIRKGKDIKVDNRWYCLYSRVWLWLRPMRSFLLRWERKIKRFCKKTL